MTKHVESTDFQPVEGKEFSKVAVYFPSMDYIDYVQRDTLTISDRIDQFLTITYDEDGEMVGFRLKGLKNVFLKKIKPTLQLTDSDFVHVRDIFIALVSQFGDALISDNAKRSAYKKAYKLSESDNVTLDVSEYKMAA
ncbi:hypothetical protein [Roseovarius sp. 217]|uniref:hypothetical protein n=1 Tax=Roseovarius sp. (strain 217) TaxID=314264 RepID=UPI000068568B|nr:hypothetical protein [Roseovarius sp. 217]EAQ24332.1 hypothetical protein ROS217_08780 [Roseovarius sp. 217]